MSMQYGHCVVRATATAISSLNFTGIAPSATAAWSKAQKAFITSGARLFMFFSLVRFSLWYMFYFLGSVLDQFCGSRFEPATGLPSHSGSADVCEAASD